MNTISKGSVVISKREPSLIYYWQLYLNYNSSRKTSKQWCRPTQDSLTQLGKVPEMKQTPPNPDMSHLTISNNSFETLFWKIDRKEAGDGLHKKHSNCYSRLVTGVNQADKQGHQGPVKTPKRQLGSVQEAKNIIFIFFHSSSIEAPFIFFHLSAQLTFSSESWNLMIRCFCWKLDAIKRKRNFRKFSKKKLLTRTDETPG